MLSVFSLQPEIDHALNQALKGFGCMDVKIEFNAPEPLLHPQM